MTSWNGIRRSCPLVCWLDKRETLGQIGSATEANMRGRVRPLQVRKLLALARQADCSLSANFDQLGKRPSLGVPALFS